MELQTESEKQLIRERYEDMLKSSSKKLTDTDLKLIDKAFNLANKAHMGVKRRSGEPYILHPIAVAKIVTHEIGLGTKSIVCALLHDVVEDTDYTIDDMERLFGKKIASIIDGLTKITNDNVDVNSSKQAENFRKIILTLADDIRVIFIKIADRLHNMRTLDSMEAKKQNRISSETIYIYAPLAYRLGLYAIKSELEDLSLRYRKPTVYQEISDKINASEKHRVQMLNHFSLPIIKKLEDSNIKFEISGRPKSIYSIWKKMNGKNISFDEVYDLLAIRIIFDPYEGIPEKTQCWNIYSIITDIYKPKPDRLRDWISTPKANGYEALHCTVMGPNGHWVEVQIRTRKMDDIAERGLAAHWKYKDMDATNQENELDKWIKEIKETIDTSQDSTLELLDEFKMSLIMTDLTVFTPKGEMHSLPKDATVLDFAFDIHTEIGIKAIGAKVNHKLVPLSHLLSAGDQVEILTAESQKPTWNLLDIATTAKAKLAIKNALKAEEKLNIENGRKILDAAFDKLGVVPDNAIINKLLEVYEMSSKEELYSSIGEQKISLENLNRAIRKNSNRKLVRYWRFQFGKVDANKKTGANAAENANRHEPAALPKHEVQSYETATCCNPIPGDDIIGFLAPDGVVKIHKSTCPEGVRLMSQFGDRIVNTKWTSQKKLSFLARLEIHGIDRMGVINDLSNVITHELMVNMSKFHLESHDGVFNGYIEVYIQDLTHLNDLSANLMKIKGMDSVKRTEIVED